MIGSIELAEVSKRYASLLALDRVSLALQPGETVALIGHNGAGKTTMMKLLLGLARPSAGEVRVMGEDPAGRRGAAVRAKVGFLPENVAFHGAMTGAEVLRFYGRLKGRGETEAADLLETVGLGEAARRRVSTYSKGMRQRLGLAQALLGEPGFLLLDEPTSGLDPGSRSQVYETIDALRRRKATVLVSTHALAEIETHVDRVALLHRGRLLAFGTLGELRRQAALPTRVRLAVVECSTEKVLQAVGPLARPVEREASQLLLEVKPEDKLALLDALAPLRPLLRDIEIETPGLDGIYRALVAEREEGS